MKIIINVFISSVICSGCGRGCNRTKNSTELTDRLLSHRTRVFSQHNREESESHDESEISTDSQSDKILVSNQIQFPDLLDPIGETIPPTLSPTDMNVAGHYILEDLVVHDAAHLLIGTRDSDSFRAVFKYQSNCYAVLWNQMCRTDHSPECDFAEQNPNALLHEYEVTKIVYDHLKLAPNPYVISAPIATTIESAAANSKTQFNMYDSRGTSPPECVAMQSTVRVLVEELVGPTVSHVFKKHMEKQRRLDIYELRIAAKVFHKTLIMLEQLHAIGIVHGDFHYGNIAFRTDEFDLSRQRVARDVDLDLVFIDFGSAVYWRDQPEYKPSDASIHRFYFLNPAWISPYQLQGHRVSRRDDLFRAFESFMDVLVFGSIGRLFIVADRVDRRVESRPKLLKLKKKMDFCSFFPSDNNELIIDSELGPDLIDAISRYPGLISLEANLGPNFLAVQEILRDIQTHVRSLKTPNVDPNYAMLINSARRIVNLLYQ